MVIPVVFSVDGNYGMFLQVAVVSLMENKWQDTEYDIYVLHADDYNQSDQNKLRKVFETYDKVNLNFIPMGNAYEKAIVSHSVMTKATFYRLSVHKIVPCIYERCIFCDTDTIINCDLSQLFHIDLGENYLAGVADPVIHYSGKREEFPDLNGYINAGLLVINLRKWREIGIEDLFEKYMTRKLKYLDQDILNLVCQGKIYLLEPHRYIVSGVLNRRIYKEIKSVVVHYCGLIKPWDVAVDNLYFRLWVSYAKKASVDVEELQLEKRRRRLDDFIRKNRIQNVIVWGMVASTLDICYFLEEIGVRVLAIGDNENEKVRMGNEYYKMIDIKGVSAIDDNVYYIINSVNYHREIKEKLMALGISDKKIISWRKFRDIIICKEERTIDETS